MSTTNTQATSNNSGKWIAAGVSLLVVGTGLFFYYQHHKKKEKQEKNATKNTNTPNTVTTTDLSNNSSRNSNGFKCSGTSYPLAYGTCHKDIKLLQNYLNKAFGTRLKVDGKFGKRTQTAANKHLKRTRFTPKEMKGLQAALNSVIRR